MKIETHGGDRIDRVAQRAVDLVASGEPFVSFDFNEVTLDVIPGETAADVVLQYHREIRRRHEEYTASPEYKRVQEEVEERERQRAAALKEALAGAPETMTLRDPEGWVNACAVNSDPYGGAVMSYAECWARLMEGEIARAVRFGATADDDTIGQVIVAHAERLSHLADSEGITGFMYGAAVSTLAAVWVHGEALRRWHNHKHQIRDEGDRANESGGVLNPAMIVAA